MTSKQIDIDICFDNCILDRFYLVQLQRILQEMLPGLKELVVEDERITLAATHSLFDCVVEEVRKPGSTFYRELSARIQTDFPKRTVSTLEVQSPDKSVCIVIDIDEFILSRAGSCWNWGNRISCQLEDPPGGIAVQLWAQEFFENACRILMPAYAHAVHVDEYDAKNMCFDRGAEAIVVDWNRSIPGLYWLNYFGQPFSGVFGSSKILASLKDEAARIGRDGVLISLGDDPYSWDSEEYKSRERKVLKILGREYFFDRADPERETVVVDEIARMIESSPAGPFDPSKPSVLRVWLDELPDEHSEGGAS